jgi:hypothetical protein
VRSGRIFREPAETNLAGPLQGDEVVCTCQARGGCEVQDSSTYTACGCRCHWPRDAVERHLDPSQRVASEKLQCLCNQTDHLHSYFPHLPVLVSSGIGISGESVEVPLLLAFDVGSYSLGSH